MNENEKIKFGEKLAEYCGALKPREIEKRIKQLYPNEPDYWISHSTISTMKKGKFNKTPDALVLKALSQVCGVRYEIFLSLAGYTHVDPLVGPREWNRDTLRDVYFEKMSLDLNEEKTLSEEEKLNLEKAVQPIVEKILINKKNSLKDFSENISKIYLNLYLDSLSKLLNVKELDDEKKKSIDRMVRSMIDTFMTKS